MDRADLQLLAKLYWEQRTVVRVKEDRSGILEDFDDEIVTDFTPAVRKDDVFVERSSGGHAIFWKKVQNIVSTPIKFNKRNMSIKLRIHGFISLILNVYSVCDYRTIGSHIEYKSIMAQFSNFCY